jgi:TetR/AcrR family transcriptional regulator, repressor for uid operon
MSQRTDQRRAEILHAAAACFIRRGFHQTSMKEVCAEAGLSPGLVYHYFASKDEIILAIADEAHRATKGLLAELDRVATLSEALALLASRLVAWLSEEGEARLYLETSVEASRSPSARAAFRASDDAFVAAIQALLNAAVQRGERLNQTNIEEIAILVGICLDGVILNAAVSGTLPMQADVLTQLLKRLVGLS